MHAPPPAAPPSSPAWPATDFHAIHFQPLFKFVSYLAGLNDEPQMWPSVLFLGHDLTLMKQTPKYQLNMTISCEPDKTDKYRGDSDVRVPSSSNSNWLTH